MENIKIGNCTIENRYVMPPMATNKSKDGSINDELIEYYKQRAGKLGLIITEHSYILKEGMAHRGQISVDMDCDIENFKKLVNEVHKQGKTKIFCQINHAGIKAKQEETGLAVVDVNTVSKQHILEIEDAFINSTIKAKEIGFDGVEIHCAHGYLLNQFYSPIYNKRLDEYGCACVDNRIRITCEIISKVKNQLKDFPVIVRFGAVDYEEGGSKLEEVARACELLKQSGVDGIDISGGASGFMIPGVETYGWFKKEAKVAKDTTNLPTILTGGIRNKQEALDLISNGYCDLVGVGRPIFADAKFIDTLFE